jgi:hypothetical protein
MPKAEAVLYMLQLVHLHRYKPTWTTNLKVNPEIRNKKDFWSLNKNNPLIKTFKKNKIWIQKITTKKSVYDQNPHSKSQNHKSC